VESAKPMRLKNINETLGKRRQSLTPSSRLEGWICVLQVACKLTINCRPPQVSGRGALRTEKARF
jgi:hypothetical protein